MKSAESWSRYILLPEEGAIAPSGPAAELLDRLPRARSMGQPEVASLDAVEGLEVTVVDTVSPDGPRLVEANAEIADMVNRSRAPLRMMPLVEFAPPDPPLRVYDEAALTASSGGTPTSPVEVEFTCTDAATGAGLAGARVLAYTDFFNEVGAEGLTGASGTLTLTLTLKEGKIERLYVYAPQTGTAYWGCFMHSLTVGGPVAVSLTPVDLSYVDSVRYYYGSSKFDAERGVEVGVIDTGVGPHRDLTVIGGANTVIGESAGDFTDPRGHGTHVAGLIGSGGAPPTGLRGLAPGVRLRAYRVFAKPPPPPARPGGATNWAIQKAIYRAVEDGCDVINLSLGGGPHDPAVERAVIDARKAGMLVVVAAGNDTRFPASFPSVYPAATAVTAMGRRGTFPVGSLEESKVAQLPEGKDPDEFLASFSNVGQEVSVTAPGVGDLSTLPGDRFGPMNGTSMAAPVVAGAVACLLSKEAAVYEMARDFARSAAIENLLLENCRSLEFGAIYEGKGMPDPAVV
ncbi:MAG TPA: S8 family serine peptidase [Solirubrobacterales bacterium]|nr:S8 family serine peptidase [Solirubrobacterales bacterium]